MKRKIYFRMFPFNRLTYPILLNIWEQNTIDSEFEIIIAHSEDFISSLSSDDIVLYSFMTPHLPIIYDELVTIRSKASPLIVAGGPHVTAEKELSYACGIDTIISGAAEASFVQFGEDVRGCESLDSMKQRVYDSVEPHLFQRYIPLSKYLSIVPPLEIIRGCTNHCSFCQTGTFKIQMRDMAVIELYCQELRKRELPRIGFIAPSGLEYAGNGTVYESLSTLFDMCRNYKFSLVEYGIFPSEIRPDTVTVPLVKLLKSHVSNKHITIGGQALNNEQLRMVNRGHSEEDIYQAIEVINSEGFKAHVDIIIAFPNETEQHRTDLIQKIKAMNKKYKVFVQLHHFFPLAGSKLGRQLPSRISAHQTEELVNLQKAGICSNWWIEGRNTVEAFIDWLNKQYPAYL